MPVCTSHRPEPSRSTVTETEVSRVLRETDARRVRVGVASWTGGVADGTCRRDGVGGAAHMTVID